MTDTGTSIPVYWPYCEIRRRSASGLAGTLYTKGLTQEQVGEVFNDIYGEHYSKASISRMLEYLRKDVTEWLERSLESYYPVVFIDCVHIKIHRKRSVDTEAFYVVLAVREDKTREVLGIFNKPTESSSAPMVSRAWRMSSARCSRALSCKDAPPI